jgi:hypothetical protein
VFVNVPGNAPTRAITATSFGDPEQALSVIETLVPCPARAGCRSKAAQSA